MLQEFPEVVVEPVSVVKEPQRMLERGIRRYPALACGEHSLSALFLTKRKIRRFLKSL